jgi:1-acyl-sn-glycerol-3-phosphate acyltransferase
MFYRRIWVYGNARIPRTGAVLFIANHPKSFMDASLVACFQHRVLNTLIRGDMFDKRWLRPLLRAVHQIPIFRRKDGFTNLKKNKGTFDACYQVFARKEALLIFPEASTMMVPYLRPLQKGAARLAIGTLEGEFSKELWVIPTGIFYAEPTRSRSDIAIHFGEPVSVSGWMEENRNCDDKIAALTEHFQEAMEKCVVSARQEGHDVLFYRLLGMLEPVLLPFTRPGLIREDMPWKTLMHIAETSAQWTGMSWTNWKLNWPLREIPLSAGDRCKCAVQITPFSPGLSLRCFVDICRVSCCHRRIWPSIAAGEGHCTEGDEARRILRACAPGSQHDLPPGGHPGNWCLHWGTYRILGRAGSRSDASDVAAVLVCICRCLKIPPLRLPSAIHSSQFRADQIAEQSGRAF